MEVYLDNSATTKPCKQAVDMAVKAMTECFGNPSSLHQKGFESLNLLEDARRTIATSLNVDPTTIYFTPCGTVSNNTSIFGAAKALKRRGNRIVTTAIEHPSVERCMDELELQGFEVIRLKPDEHGNIDISEFEKVINEDTILVSCMAVNNEVGSVLPFDKIKKVIKSKKSPALLHVDAVQAYLKINIKPQSSGIDLLSMSAHKVHGLKGSGALYIDKNVHLKPYILGGGQENNMCSGTQAMPAIVAFAEAVKAFGKSDKRFEHVKELNDHFKEKISSVEGVEINSPDNALPYIINVSLDKIPSQVSVNYLSMNGVYVSAGSACSKGHRSDVLLSMNLSPERIDNAIRISLSYENTIEEIDYCVEMIQKALIELRKK